MNYGIALFSIVPMRREPREQSEMVSQLLFGECYEVLDNSNGWLNILTLFDHYTGWIDSKLHQAIHRATFDLYTSKSAPVLSSLHMKIKPSTSSPFTILAGSSLPGYENNKGTLTVEGKVFEIIQESDEYDAYSQRNFSPVVEMFGNTPYLWGGRTVFGCDCSGFVQSVYKILGISLHRDSSQQHLQGTAVNSLAEAKQGDLGFFADGNGKVIHVGLIMSANEIAHCSGFVRKDSIDDTGIFNEEIQQYTHHLVSIRRIQPA